MVIKIYDCEVFRFDWVVCIYNTATQKWSTYHNDNAGVRREFTDPDALWGGFNNKHYDDFIIAAICRGADPEVVKQLNDFIIKEDGRGYDFGFIRYNKFKFHSFDLMDDTQIGTSLKSIEAHLGMDIEETEVDFDIDRPLTPEELESTIRYCKYDVWMTARLMGMRKDYLEGKMALGRLKEISDRISIGMTNAKLTAAFLGARMVCRNDEADYKYPDALRLDRIPPAVLEFFERLCRSGTFKETATINIGKGVMVTYGSGGVHQGIKNHIEFEGNGRVIRNFDVASLYPSLMILFNYISRNIADPQNYISTYHTRLAAKSTDKKLANTLKLPLNTAFGAMLNRYNALYDPLMGRSVCVSGQLFLTELVCAYMEACPSLRVLNFNTDGVMFSIDEVEMKMVYEINEEWQQRTGFLLEEDMIRGVWQKDVNNYILEDYKGKTKCKGAYVTHGIAEAGAFSINNNHPIVKKAVIAHFTKGIPVEVTINGCNEIKEFQIIAKVGSKFKACYHLVKGERMPIQRVNRVYATTDERYGTLIRVHATKGNDNKIGGLPEHCFIDNRNRNRLEHVDKQWYIDLAHKYINDFTGVEKLTSKLEGEDKE